MNTTNAQRAAAFFHQPAWSRLLDALYEKYIAQGRPTGQVILHACTAEEQREIARFLKKRLPSDDTLVVRLSDFQRALDESGFPCTLAELLTALYPERSHMTRPEQRQQRVQIQQRFYEDLSSLADTLPVANRGRNWLLAGAHGRDYLFRRYKNEDPALQKMVLLAVRTVVEALNRLPVPPAAYERLSLFAQRISGDPHRLDAQFLPGRLFLYALQDLTALDHPRSSQQTIAERAAKSAEETRPIQTSNADSTEEDTTLLREQQRHLLYYEAGLLTDTISSAVATFQLAYAEDASGRPDPLIENAGSRILVLPLRQLLAWKKLAPASKHVYLFENPQVFENIVDVLQQRARNGNDEQQGTLPTLICTSGWLSGATIQLLNLLTETTPDITLHYSGDFDLPGLRIAAYLQKRYPAHCQLWHIDPSSYLAALHQQSISFDSNDLASLLALPAQFAPLVTVMQEKGMKAYQEGITHLLLNDIIYF